MKRYFITASGTDIGKTFVTSALIWQLRQKGLQVNALKPVASGVDENSLKASDAGQLLSAMEKPLADINNICPWRYRAPLSPDMAAKKEGLKYSFDELIAFCNSSSHTDIQLIEGVGGVMSPVTAKHTVLDWIEALAIPIILVTGSYVGTISHTITALACIRQRGLKVHSIMLNESPDSQAGIEETAASLKIFMKENIPVQILRRLDSLREVWKNAPDIAQGLI